MGTPKERTKSFVFILNERWKLPEPTWQDVSIERLSSVVSQPACNLFYDIKLKAVVQSEQRASESTETTCWMVELARIFTMTEYLKNPIFDALRALTGVDPPKFTLGVISTGDLSEDDQIALQCWCVNNVEPYWATGLSLMDAADSIVDEAIGNNNIVTEEVSNNYDRLQLFIEHKIKDLGYELAQISFASDFKKYTMCDGLKKKNTVAGYEHFGCHEWGCGHCKNRRNRNHHPMPVLPIAPMKFGDGRGHIFTIKIDQHAEPYTE